MHLSGDSQSARRLFEQALPMLQSTLGEQHIEVGRCLIYLGMSIVGCGETGVEYLLNHALPILVDFYSDYLTEEKQLSKLLRVCTGLGDMAGLQLLIHLKVFVDEPDLTSGQTALHCAVMRGYRGCVKLLLEAAADPNCEDLSGRTPIDLAENNSELFELFNKFKNKAYI